MAVGHTPFGTRATGGGLRPINPLGLSGLELYLRGDTLTGSQGALVATWPDSSGHSPARDATAGGVANPPVLDRAPSGGANAVRFNGDASDGVMSGTLPAGLNQWPNGYTLYYHYVVDAFVDGTSQVGAQLLGGQVRVWEAAADGLGVGNRHLDFNINGVHDAGLNVANAAHLIAVVATPPQNGAGIATAFQDGVQVTSWSGWNWNPVGGYTVGNNGSQTRNIHGRVCCVVLFSQAHNTTTRQGVSAFLRSIYG